MIAQCPEHLVEVDEGLLINDQKHIDGTLCILQTCSETLDTSSNQATGEGVYTV